uniref:Mitochondrial-processing peptidase subunit alpha n=1 Tax=Hirondellea gigas TaxID=1518452 RepID=A0A6A7FVU7_9CRUS
MMNIFKSGLSRLRVTQLHEELQNFSKCSSKIIRHSSSSSGSGGSSNNSGSNPIQPSTKSPTYHTATQPEPLIDYSTKHKSDADTPSKLPKIATIPLSEEVPWIPKPIYSTESESDRVTQVTTLDNGIRVASEPKFGSFCTVGVVLDSGSRYEVAYPSGISHFLEKLAFGDTVNMKRQQIMDTFEKLGGICDCQTLRDAVIYAASVESKGLERVVEVLSEVVWRPLITEQEFEMAQMAVSYDLENLALRPEKDALLMEMIHKAAYRDNTVGLPKICPSENITKIQIPKLLSYLKHHHGPERLVVAGVGVDHDLLVRHVEQYFKSGTATWDTNPQQLHPHTAKTGVDSSLAQYTGGVCLEEADLSKVSIGPNPLPELCHLVLGLESVSHQHPDFVACCVLNVLMGGGGSFSAGGPGKGMYTRLYTNVLNKHHWMHNAVAFNHAYGDTGLFCILASSHPSHLFDLTEVLTREMVAMATTITHSELQRAKTQLQSMVLMNLESRPVVFEDMARQVLATGDRKQPTYFIERISEISLDDVHRVAGHMLKSKLSMAAYGTLAKLPKRETVQAALMDKLGRLKPRSGLSLFR